MIPSDPFWTDRTVFVTGCTGFLGRWLTRRLLEHGSRVIGFSRNEAPPEFFSGGAPPSRFTSLRGSLADRELLSRTIADCGVDTVFHLAAQSKVENAQQRPLETFEVNVQGTWNLLEAVRGARRPIGVVQASTDKASEHFKQASESPGPAGQKLSPYAASKVCAEVLGTCYQQTYGVTLCTARTSNLYGGGDFSFERIIPGTIRAVLCGEVPEIMSNGLGLRDYLYVEDAVTGYMLLAAAMGRPEVAGRTFTFCSESPITVLTIVETILKQMGHADVKPRVLGRGGSPAEILSASAGKARELLGWAAASSLETGLKKTIEWYRAHANELNLEARNG